MMKVHVYSILKSMIEFSKSGEDHLTFLRSVHKLLFQKINLKNSFFIFGIEDYFLKSSYQAPPDEYWYIRTNEIKDNDRFSRLALISEKEASFNEADDLKIIIKDKQVEIGIILIKNIGSDPNIQKHIDILNEIKDFLYFICKSLFRRFQLNERIKELNCLRSISRLADNRKFKIPELLSEIVMLLPPAWLYPDYARARIIYNNHSYCTEKFEESDLSMKANILVDNYEVGSIEVNYPSGFLQKDDFPFLKEEELLINLIAQELNIILEKKRANEENIKLEKQLLHADRLATLGQLSAGIAHEINEPLAGILGLAQLMGKNDSLDKQTRNDLENIVSASLHAREVVKKLMLFSRQMPSSQTRININDAIRNAIFFLDSRCRKNMIELDHELIPGIPDIIADSSQIHQVLINLIVNSLQAMPEGGKITLKTGFNEENVILECIDTGVGMTKDVMRQVFNPFFTTKKVNEGTGLGLSVVHGIIYSHNGEIKVFSKPGEGTRFRITLPCARRNK